MWGLSFLRETTSQWQILNPLLSFLLSSQFDADPASACVSLQQEFTFTNVTILSSTYYPNATTEAGTLGACMPTANIAAPLCRVQFVVNTSSTSSVTAEAWLPEKWSGRFLTAGNGGLGGCIDYANLNYGSSLEFATVASNNGHDGDTGVYFGNPEVLADFSGRSIHVISVVGKQITAAYYGRPHHKSYFIGCSTGGRQGTYAALHYPEDFDGIVAGASSTNFHRLIGWSGMLSKYLGAPNVEPSASFITPTLWKVVSEEILRQCDELDGVKDGIITEPDACEFRPEAVQCLDGSSSNCLSGAQVEALRKIYEPLYGLNGELIFPRYDPGAEAIPDAQLLFHGGPYYYTEHWMKYVVYNGTTFDYSSFGLKDIEYADRTDPGGISTNSGDLSVYNARGGKFIAYHGRRDEIVPAGNAKAFYNLVSRTLGMPSLDSFYRLFLVPGLDHCRGGAGAVNIGQDGKSHPSRATASHNVLLAMAEWVERGIPPDTITGISKDGVAERVHCRYPQRSVWNGSAFYCAP